MMHTIIIVRDNDKKIKYVKCEECNASWESIKKMDADHKGIKIDVKTYYSGKQEL